LENRNRSHHRKYQPIIRTKKEEIGKRRETENQSPALPPRFRASRGICRADAWHSLHAGSGRVLAPGFWPPSTHGWCTIPSLTDGVCLFLTPQPANKKRWISKHRATVSPCGARSFFSALHASSGGCSILRHTLFFQRLLISLLTSWSTVSVVPQIVTEDSRAEHARGRDC
jgi:hypothetical protein